MSPCFRLVRAPLLTLCLAASAQAVAAQDARTASAAPITYRSETLAPGETSKRFTPSQLGLLEKLNRRDAEHLARLTQVLVPDLPADGWPADELAFAPLPVEWPWAATLPKAILVHQPAQVFGAYESGRLVRWGPVSTGRRETPTPDGVFNLTWKARSRVSTDNAAWLLKWYFNFINNRGVSFHEFELPGMAASHACVRLLTRDAMWLYDWGEQWQVSADGRSIVTPGTTVVVQGRVDFRTPAPWTAPDWWRVPLTVHGSQP